MEKSKEINVIEDYFKKLGLTQSLEKFRQEIVSKTSDKSSKLTKVIAAEKDVADKYAKIKKESEDLNKKQLSIFACNKKIYPIVKSCLKTLSDIADNNFNMDNLSDTIESYKIDLGKYTNIIKNDYWDEKIEMLTLEKMKEKKKLLIQANKDKNNEKIVELLLDFRVNALQIDPDLRSQFINQCVEINLFDLSSGEPTLVLDLLNYHAFNIRHAVLSVVSIMSSILQGVDYFLTSGFQIIARVFEIMKVQEHGSVIQRFCIAILQKCSSREKVVPVYLKSNLVEFTVKLLENSKISEIHIFCLDFATACLTNIFHSSKAIDFLEKNVTVTKKMVECFLAMVSWEEVATSVLMHLLICLSYLTGPKFRKIREETRFLEKLSSFSTKYASNKSNTDVVEKDKRTIIELCNQLYSDAREEINSMPDSTMSYDERIQEYEQEQGHIIFECFQDEIS